jgi:hypothetical protein
MKGRGRYVLLSVLVVQLILTASVFLPSPHNGGDNAGYVTLAHSLLDRGAYLELWDPMEVPHTKYPPVFPLLLAGVMALGVKGWVGLKTIPFLSTLLAGAFTFLWVRGRSGILLAAGIALLLALSDGILDYSRWVLSDPTFLALTVGALWALERAGRAGDEGVEDAPEGPGPSQDPGPSGGWLGLGFALVVLAYFTRSAGLPLVVATMAWLGLRRWWRGLTLFLLSFSLPAGLWWLRGRIQGGSEYVAEFWFIDPYRPEMGQIGVSGLFGRVWENLLNYVSVFIPEGIVGGESWFLLPLGVALSLLALVGWIRSLREEVRVTEIFLPLYGGLMCLWPGVWSGDRFALPLLPILLFYAAMALHGFLKGLKPTLRGGALALGFLLVAVPALGNWRAEVRVAQECRPLVAEKGSWACHGLGVQGYVVLAGWSGENLPPGAAVVTRKPRIFYVQSGVKTMSLPLTTDAGEFLSASEAKGARYLTADWWDGLASYYLPRILSQEPGSFCFLTGAGVGGEMGIQLLGITPGGEGEAGSLSDCPGGMVGEARMADEPVSPWEIPLLIRGSGSP